MKWKKNNMKFFKFKRNSWYPYLFLLVINLIFFLPLFFPQLKIVITPEYGGGDENIFHYPIKFLYQNRLMKNSLLLWSKDIGGGYPIFAEGEAGLLSPLNLILFKYLPFWFAINFQLFLSFYILLCSSYYLGSVFKLKKISSIYFSSIFTYSFFIIANIIHVSHLLSFIFLPLCFSLVIRFISEEKNNFKYLFLLLITTFLQLLSGHIQYFFYTFFLIFGYLFFSFIIQAKRRREIFFKAILVFLVYLFTLCLGSVQLLPTYEFYKYSVRQMNIFNGFNRPSNFSLNGLFTLLYPFIEYDINLIPRKPFSNLLPPWDGNFYFGTFPFFLTFLLFNLKLRLKILKTHKDIFLVILILLIVFILLSYGSNSPLYFVYSFPPFSFFRVNERLSLIVILFFSLFSAIVFNYLLILKKRLINFFLITLIIVNFLSNVFLMHQFHLLTTPKEFLKENSMLKEIRKFELVRIYNPYFFNELLPFTLWKKGLIEKSIYLEMIKNGLPLNFNLFYGLSHFNEPTSAFNLLRHSLYLLLIHDSEETYMDHIDTKKASFSPYAKNLLQYAAIDKIISPNLIVGTSSYLKLIAHFTDVNSNYYIYKPLIIKKRVQFYQNIKIIETFNDFKNQLKKDNLVKTVYLEDKVNKKINLSSSINRTEFIYNIIKDEDEDILIETNSLNNGILVLADNYYPGWKAYIDGKETKIFRANFLFRGIYLPKEKHLVEFKYIPESFYLGIKISLTTVAFLMLIVIVIFLRKHFLSYAK